MALKIEGLTDRIVWLCKAHGLGTRWTSQRAFAADFKLDPQKLNEWLRGTQPDAAGLRKLEETLGAPIAWLLVGESGAEVALRWWRDGGSAMIGRARGDPGAPLPGTPATQKARGQLGATRKRR